MDGLYGVAVVEGVTKTEVFPFFHQAEIGGVLSLQLDANNQQALLLLDLALSFYPSLGQPLSYPICMT